VIQAEQESSASFRNAYEQLEAPQDDNSFQFDLAVRYISLLNNFIWVHLGFARDQNGWQFLKKSRTSGPARNQYRLYKLTPD
jgi:hypothetical protein